MSAAPDISFGVVARRRIPELDRLVDALLALDGPPSEIVVAVEATDVSSPRERPDERGVRWIDLPAHRGLGYNRNRLLDAVCGEILVGVDDDCVPTPGWLPALLGGLEDPDIDVAVGGVLIPAAGFVGDSISALGFPAGGSAGFETIFRVEPDGRTNHISTVDYAARVVSLRDVGGFDESLTYGCEDTDLARRLLLAGHTIVHVRTAFVQHPARTSLVEFTRWFFVRGRAECQLSRRTGLGGYVGQRFASYGRIVRAHARDPKLLLIVPLIVGSVVCQQAGFLVEAIRPTRPPVQREDASTT